MRFLVIILLLISTIATPALSASNDKTNEETKKAEKINTLPDATDRQMRESKAFYRHCVKNAALDKRHECKCLAAEYLIKRIEYGDKEKSGFIISKLRNVCLKPEYKDDIKSEEYDEDMSEIPQEILDEADTVYNDCAANTDLSAYHDCECLAGKFLKDRMELGPMAFQNNILSKYQGECKNPAGIAGNRFTNCMANWKLNVPKDMRPRAFCECYAKTYAEQYEKITGAMSGQSKSQMDSFAYGTCDNKLRTNPKNLR